MIYGDQIDTLVTIIDNMYIYKNYDLYIRTKCVGVKKKSRSKLSYYRVFVILLSEYRYELATTTMKIIYNKKKKTTSPRKRNVTALHTVVSRGKKLFFFCPCYMVQLLLWPVDAVVAAAAADPFLFVIIGSPRPVGPITTNDNAKFEHNLFLLFFLKKNFYS